ncbi:N-acyl homoserine lactonase family protein [Pedobacter sp.]|uniref:N-acyl homoserine lactonase family protein n=1 Tax=Pedobacter sp. TaxID=1411316 RepID=UPI003D7FC9A9
MSIKIHVLHCGQVKVDRSLPFHEKTINPISYTGIFRSEKEKIWLPVSAYLIEHPKGLILIDTGWHTDVRTDQKKHLGLLHYIINKADLPEGQAITEQLQQRGIKPSDIDFLVMSHLHSDHASGMKLVKDAKKILVSDIEVLDTQKHKIAYVSSMWDDVKFDTFKFQPSNYGNEKLSFDLFGDDSVVFVNTPGHTMGLASTIIQNNGKFVLLCADTGYAKKSWEQMIMPGVMVDKKKVIRSLKWVKQMSQQPNCVEVIANHDTNIKPHTVEL